MGVLLIVKSWRHLTLLDPAIALRFMRGDKNARNPQLALSVQRLFIYLYSVASTKTIFNKGI
jgi:hypothetical protein